jgi:ABC-2 type transport system ATP-binding protein
MHTEGATHMIELRGMTKRYGPTLAVDDLSFQVQSGKVTRFLGPNGAGKSTSMRMVLGLDRPTAGHALVHGRRYQELRAPLRVVGALLDAGAVHPRRSARSHLLALAQSNGIPRSRVEEVLGLVGLDKVAGRRVGGSSLGMRQRLGIAAALVGITTAVAVLFAPPIVGALVSSEIVATVMDYLPAGLSGVVASGTGERYSPEVAALLLGAWAIATLAVGAITLHRRDL